MRIDWTGMWLPEHVPEMVLRGTVMYLALFVLLRIMARREMGGLAPSNLLVLVIIADAAQNGMAGEYSSVSDGLVLVATILGWSLLADYLSYHFPVIGRLTKPPALPLVREGKLIRRNLRRELITEDELMSQLRQHDVHDLTEVDTVRIEFDGHISVVRR